MQKQHQTTLKDGLRSRNPGLADGFTIHAGNMTECGYKHKYLQRENAQVKHIMAGKYEEKYEGFMSQHLVSLMKLLHIHHVMMPFTYFSLFA